MQQFIEGVSAAAVYVAVGGSAELLGVSRQLVGESWLHAPAFRYCGSIGPIGVEPGLRERLARLGNELVDRTGAHGLFGIDGILADGAFWPVEVNPRYTASVEVLEYATGLCALVPHRQAFDPLSPRSTLHPSRSSSIVGKAILYARADGVFPQDGPWRTALDAPLPAEEMPAFADLPHAGDRIDAGRPVLTMLARAATEEACLVELRQKADEVERWLYS